MKTLLIFLISIGCYSQSALDSIKPNIITVSDVDWSQDIILGEDTGITILDLEAYNKEIEKQYWLGEIKNLTKILGDYLGETKTKEPTIKDFYKWLQNKSKCTQ